MTDGRWASARGPSEAAERTGAQRRRRARASGGGAPRALKEADQMSDEHQIRALIESWMSATAAGDIARVLELMDEDVVFLGPGRVLMRGRDAFAAAAKSMEGKVRFEGSADIQ